jgi:glutathione S-transferase
VIKLYYIPQSRATRPRWLLEEMGVPYELVRLPGPLAERKASDYVKIHPHARVPALADGDTTMFESAAICLYLADKFMDKGFAPALDSPERGPYLQWTVYSMVTLEPPIYQIYRHTDALPEEQRSQAALAEARASFAEVAGVLEKVLGEQPFIVGKDFTAADVMIGATLNWARNIGLLEGYPALLDYVKRLNERPAFKRSRAD